MPLHLHTERFDLEPFIKDACNLWEEVNLNLVFAWLWDRDAQSEEGVKSVRNVSALSAGHS